MISGSMASCTMASTPQALWVSASGSATAKETSEPLNGPLRHSCTKEGIPE